jgi:uncharacterized protein (TIGR02466 family)
VLLAGCDRFVSSYSRTSKASDPSAVASQGQTEVNQQRVQGQEKKQDSQRHVQTMGETTSMSDYHINWLFPQPVGYNKLDREFTKEELRFIKERSRSKNTGNYDTKDSYVLNNPELSDLKADMQTLVDAHFQNVYKPLPDVKLVVTQSWANYTNKDEYHHTHYHQNSFLSGVLYIQTNPNNTDQIRFHDPIRNQFALTCTEWTALNSDSWRLQVENGVVFLFPSFLQHDVPKVEGNTERTSIAFNTFFDGRIGDADSKTELFLRSNVFNVEG